MAPTDLCSVIVPVFNEEEVLPLLHERLTATLSRLGLDWEIVYVNDGSRDRSWSILEELQARDPHVVAISLSRNFGHQLAVSAGLDKARGDAIVFIDADLQDPPELIEQFVARWREGYDVAYGLREKRLGESIFKKVTAALFYRTIRKLTAVDIPADTGDFRIVSRRVADVLRQLPEKHRFIRGLVSWVGFRQIAVPYVRQARAAGETKYPLARMVKFAADALTSFSTAPLRLATTAGIAAAGIAFLYAAWAVYEKLFSGATIQGWASLFVLVALLGSAQLLALGIIGAYVGRIYEQIKDRPLYVIAEHRTSRLDALVQQAPPNEFRGTATASEARPDAK
ncbi:glycosyltransferase family 2 protein [Vulgatibacter sp.]|uniref:glycosyltransferase family 2 protein n=1 Tax=Vulgatibacter sp. TaxID=1971226 RepID=UPI0035617BD8